MAKAVIATIVRIGLDIAKDVFQLHGVDQHDKPQLRKRLPRGKVLAFLAQQPPCEIGIEACGSAHYWARELIKLGHTVKLIAPQFVTPYRTKGKNGSLPIGPTCSPPPPMSYDHLLGNDPLC
jgi:transposase